VASLYVGGATPDFTRFFQGRDARRVVAPTYPFEGKRYRKGGEPPSAPAADTSEVVRSLESGDPQALTRLVEAGAGWSRTESDLFSQFAAKIIDATRRAARRRTPRCCTRSSGARARGRDRTGGAGGDVVSCSPTAAASPSRSRASSSGRGRDGDRRASRQEALRRGPRVDLRSP
jgi:acyl transferase domain-containing protein